MNCFLKITSLWERRVKARETELDKDRTKESKIGSCAGSGKVPGGQRESPKDYK